jgi:hypothetical protein
MAIPSKFDIPNNRRASVNKVHEFAPIDINRLHFGSDVDSGTKAQHHTLGVSRNQAAQGNHMHDGITSKKLGQGMGITITGSRGGNAAIASIITALKQVMDLTDNTTA